MAKAKTAQTPAAPAPKKGSKPPVGKPTPAPTPAAQSAPEKAAEPKKGKGAPTPPAVPPAPKVNAPMPTEERPVLYDKMEFIHLSSTCEEATETELGDSKFAVWPALTDELAKELIGWEEVEVKDDSVILTDEAGHYVRFHNNGKNRAYDHGTAKKYAYDILNRFWADSRNGDGCSINGETIIIGRTGNVTSGQHRLSALVLACQIWEQEPHWKEKWSEKPTLEGIIVRGTDEAPHTLRTLDNVKPRSVEDVFYANTEILNDLGKTDRKTVIKAAANAVRVLWDRTGLKDNPYTPYLSNSEAVEFLESHVKILDAATHIWESDKAVTGGAVTGNKGLKLGLGTAAGLMYLMAASNGDHDDYIADPNDKTARIEGWGWEKAEEFWTLLATQHPDVREVRNSSVQELVDDGSGELKERERFIFTSDGKRDEKVAILVNAFNEYANGGVIKAKVINPPAMWKKQDDGSLTLVEPYPILGGIDIGGIKEKDSEDADSGEAAAEPEPELTPEQVEQNKADAAAERRRKAELAAEKIRKMRAKSQDDTRAPGEPMKPEPTQYDKDGKPPMMPLKGKPAAKPIAKPAAVEPTATPTSPPKGKKPTPKK